MPHKRAKRSAREEHRQQRGVDLAPGKDVLNSEVMPKSASRVINAAKIREEWRAKRKRLEPDSEKHSDEAKRRRVRSDDDRNNTHLREARSGWKIQPGEPIQHFNRRVEDGMRPIVRSAIQASKATVRRNLKAGMETRQCAKAPRQSPSKASHPDAAKAQSKRKRSTSPVADANVASAKEFAKASTSLPRRLNDVAQAPPSLITPRLSAKMLQKGIRTSKNTDVLSMAQRSLMEVEREHAILRYRQLKAAKGKLHGSKGTDEGEALVAVS